MFQLLSVVIRLRMGLNVSQVDPLTPLCSTLRPLVCGRLTLFPALWVCKLPYVPL